MAVEPQKRMVTLGVNALARETGLPRQTVSDRMRKGATVAEIRIYAAMRESRWPVRQLAGGSMRREAPKFRGRRLKFDATLQTHSTLEAIGEARLRRTKALAEKQEFEIQQLRSQVTPRVYVREWASRFLVDGREELMKGPGELQDVLASERDPWKVAAVLRAWLEHAMAKFAQNDKLWQGELDNEQVA